MADGRSGIETGAGNGAARLGVLGRLFVLRAMLVNAHQQASIAAKHADDESGLRRPSEVSSYLDAIDAHTEGLCDRGACDYCAETATEDGR